MKRKQLFPGKPSKPTWEGLRARQTDSGIEVGGTMNLSTPIVSVQDGPRVTMSMKNFGGKKAAPFRKGKKRRAKVLLAKNAVRKGKGADLANTEGFQPKPYDANGEGRGEPVTCPKCHKGNAADARFCDQCGFKLAGAQGVKVR